MSRCASALMRLATEALGRERRDWAAAMQAEYEAAHADGHALTFALGCLITAVRMLPYSGESRFMVMRHMVALVLVVPIAFLPFACALGLLVGQPGPYGTLAADADRYPLLATAQLGALPALLGLWLLLGFGQLRLAWAVLDGDWTRTAQAAALIAAAMITLLLFSQVLLVQIASLLPLGAGLATEALLLLAAAWRHEQRRACQGSG